MREQLAQGTVGSRVCTKTLLRYVYSDASNNTAVVV